MNPPMSYRIAAQSPAGHALRRTLFVSGIVLAGVFAATPASAQITTSRSLTGGGSPVATLDEQLINRLRATTDAQQVYLRYIVKLVDQEKLEPRLVLAIERYAMRRNPRYPFPYFERALRYEAAKRGVTLPPIRHYQSTIDRRR